MDLHFVHSVKKQVVKLRSIRETLVLLENCYRQMFWPRNDDRKLLHCYGQQLWFNFFPGSLINHDNLRIRGQDISPMLNWLKTLDLLIQVTRECYNNVCE